MPEDITTLALEAVAELNRSERPRRCVIGITGPPGAGKSTLMEALVRECVGLLGDPLVVGLPMDGFHIPNRLLVERGALKRKGAADTFDASAFVAALRSLACEDAEPLSWPAYSRRLHEPIPGAIVVPGTVRLAFVEGNYLLLRRPRWEEAQTLFSAVWYLSADPMVIEARLHQRHLISGRSATDIKQRVKQDLENLALVEQTRLYADRVIEVSGEDPLLRGLTDPATGRPIMLDEAT